MPSCSISVDHLSLLLISSVRYALGRQTYIVADTANIVRKYSKKLTKPNKEVIIRDIETALLQGRAGSAIDHQEWVTLLQDLKQT